MWFNWVFYKRLRKGFDPVKYSIVVFSEDSTPGLDVAQRFPSRVPAPAETSGPMDVSDEPMDDAPPQEPDLFPPDDPDSPDSMSGPDDMDNDPFDDPFQPMGPPPPVGRPPDDPRPRLSRQEPPTPRPPR